MKLDNLATGLGIAVAAFAVVQYFKGSATRASAAGNAIVAANPNAGAVWQTLTMPLGSATGGTNMNGSLDQVYSSTSWNPDDLSATIGADAQAAMGAAGQGTANAWGFHL
ncbi:hypothetical protein [Burkholderia arboris]|uniref:hypothetical protein n=1 Tax=Burkholderia arboris TaxID=488730 RepID=UPI00210ECF05|nr:hypothetical protein [Burkholderia arboris]UTV53241.1 hypothetical protein NLX30_10085 [Burkholderia arboris]